MIKIKKIIKKILIFFNFYLTVKVNKNKIILFIKILRPWNVKKRLIRIGGSNDGGYIIPDDLMKQAIFHEEYSEMVIVKDIEVYSMCEHHMLPFFGKAHIAYIPNGYIVGLSKIPRIVDAFARRLQVQERLTTEIRDCIQDTLQPTGVAVVIECSHLCMQMRGIQKQNSVTTTSAFTGEFLKDTTRSEFISLIQAKLH